MKHFARLGFVSVLLSALTVTATAQTNSGGGSWLPEIQPSHQYFMRFGWASMKMNNKSEAAYDTDGPVLAAGERGQGCTFSRCGTNNNNTGTLYVNKYNSALTTTLFDDPANPQSGISGPPSSWLNGGVLGIPDNVKARASDADGAFGSIGMYLDEDQNWAVEALVLGLPFKSEIEGAGAFEGVGKIITTKFLPPTAFLHYYFGKKGDAFRPSISAALNYTIFFDARATSEFQALAGGRTTVSLKNSLGFGLFVGGTYNLTERWSLNANLGQLKAKTEATIRTYDTYFESSSAILQYYPSQLAANIASLTNGGAPGNLTDGTLSALINYRNNGHQVNGGANLGNFTRKQKQTLDPYVLFMSVGYNF